MGRNLAGDEVFNGLFHRAASGQGPMVADVAGETFADRLDYVFEVGRVMGIRVHPVRDAHRAPDQVALRRRDHGDLHAAAGERRRIARMRVAHPGYVGAGVENLREHVRA